MTLEAWALFCLTEFVLCLHPGPSALVVISQSLTAGTRSGIRATAGVLVANAFYFALSATGLVAVHSLSAEAFALIKWVGAGYLAWLGGSMLWRSFRRAPARVPVGAAPRNGAFWRGFVTQGANPNLLIYFTAILPQFLDPSAPIASQVAILAVSSFVIEFTVLSVYSGMAGRAGVATAPRFHAYLERIGGGLLLGAAAGLARIEQE